MIMAKQRITFVLPHATNVPIGGYKAVYQFSNGLVERGHQVTVILPWMTHPVPGIASAIKANLRPLIYRLKPPLRVTWFDVDPRVELKVTSDLRQRWIPESDFVIATSWATAPHVNSFSTNRGRKLYLLQHLETFGGPQDEVIATWKLPLQKLAIATWLNDYAESLGEKTIPIRVGVDLDQFGLDAPVESRANVVSMLYSDSVIKGGADGLKALAMVKRRVPDLQVRLFGSCEPPSLPEWMTYERNVSGARLREIYNESAVFAHPSTSEGWPAPPAEAMACGVAVAASANPGILDYAKPGITAVTSKPGDWSELAGSISTLLTDRELRFRVAANAVEDVQQYSWKHAQQRFAEVIDLLSS
jgi:glycosyltransferase involved in cell wall biosynthesis